MNADDTQATGTVAPEDITTDTVDTQPSEASVQSNEAPEAAQIDAEVKGTEATEVKAEDTAAEKLYAGKYKTPEEMEQGYKNLESRFGKETSEKAELARILNDAFTAPEAKATETDDDYSTESIDPRYDKLEKRTAVATFVITHPDANGDVINKILAEDPFVSNISGVEARLEYAYLKSQNIAKPKAIAEAQKKTAQATQAKILEKENAQVESAGRTVQTDENAELRNKATGNYNQADRDAARKAWIRKNLVNLN